MCGIVGYIGKNNASQILLDGLEKLEYRGYDSSGIAVEDANGEIKIKKAKGRLSILSESIDGGKSVVGNCGIGHTRWATHGEPNETNAHPHTSDDKNSVVLVHNGIIENYAELKLVLEGKGYKFYSETDTEVAAKLLHYYLYSIDKSPIKSICHFMSRVRGSYALAVMFKDYPNEIYAFRKDCPLIIGKGEGESFIASDVPAILKYTNNVFYMDNFEIARLESDNVEFFNQDGKTIEKTSKNIDLDVSSIEKCGYKHFMLKEIHEQPDSIRKTIASVVDGFDFDLKKIGIDLQTLKKVNNIIICGCGSAYHVGVALKYVFEGIAKIPVQVDFASEFRYRQPIIFGKPLMIVISQSGETADTLAAMNEAKKLGVKTLAIVNVEGSSIARVADYVFYTKAGPEIAVATTKAYSAQLVAGYLLAIKIALEKHKITQLKYEKLLEEIRIIPAKIDKILSDETLSKVIAHDLVDAHDVFFIGRGIDYAVSLEGGLKMKEVSYIHTDSYPAGELKHGTISLIEKGTPVIGVLTQKNLLEKTLSNMQETKSRGAKIIAVTTDEFRNKVKSCDFTIIVPKINPYFSASLAIIPLQLASYYLSDSRGIDVDKPRNLAKSVTVE